MKMKRDMKRYFEITNGRYLRSLLILAMMMVGEAVGLWGADSWLKYLSDSEKCYKFACTSIKSNKICARHN